MKKRRQQPNYYANRHFEDKLAEQDDGTPTAARPADLTRKEKRAHKRLHKRDNQ